MKFKIELKYFYGWDDAGWTDNDGAGAQPTRFESATEAQIALEEFFADVAAAVAANGLASGHDRSDYRVVKMKR